MTKILILHLLTLSLIIGAGEFHRSISSYPARVNPVLATDSVSGEITGWVFSGLLKFDKNGSISSDMAESWKFEDNRTLIFHLKKGILWHDGKEFTADDVKFTYNFMKLQKVVTPYKSEFKYVKDVKVLDPYTLRVEYKKPYFKALSIWMMGILPEHLWRDEKEPMQSLLNRTPVGTGAYKIVKPLKVNSAITLIANDKYYEHPPNIKKQIFHYIADPSTEFMMLKANRLDIGSITPLQMAREVDDKFKKNYKIYERPSNSYTYLGFNLKREKFKDKRVREAITLAIDKKEIIDLLFFSHGKVCNGPFMPNSSVYPKDFTPIKYNPEYAKRVLKEAGYDEKHPLKFTLITNSGNEVRVYTAEIIQQQLKRIGVEMKIRTLEWQAFLNTVVFPRNFEAVLLGWGLSLIPDAYSIWHSEGDKKGGFNFIGYHNRDVDRLIKESEGVIDQERFAKIYGEIFKLIVEDYPYVFLYIPNSITAVNSRIKNITPSIIGIEHNFIDWVKDKR
jgi:peptide/nickel transport system substrate-binding protein